MYFAFNVENNLHGSQPLPGHPDHIFGKVKRHSHPVPDAVRVKSLSIAIPRIMDIFAFCLSKGGHPFQKTSTP